MPADTDAAVARGRRLILVVDRDSRRGLDLAIAVLASPGGAPAFMGRGAPPTAEPTVGVTVITRDVHLTCDFDSLRAGMTCRLVPLSDGKSEDDQYGSLEHTGTVAEPRGALILDNPPADQSQELVGFQQRFLSVVIISAYPVFRPGVDAIVASPADNEFTWPSLYDAFLSTNGSAVKEEYSKVTRKLVDNSALCLRASSRHATARTWSISTMAARRKPVVVEPPPSLSPSPLPAPIFA